MATEIIDSNKVVKFDSLCCRWVSPRLIEEIMNEEKLIPFVAIRTKEEGKILIEIANWYSFFYDERGAVIKVWKGIYQYFNPDIEGGCEERKELYDRVDFICFKNDEVKKIEEDNPSVMTHDARMARKAEELLKNKELEEKIVSIEGHEGKSMLEYEAYKELKEENKELQQKCEVLEKENKELKEEYKELQQKCEVLEKENEQIHEAYEKLKEDSKDIPNKTKGGLYTVIYSILTCPKEELPALQDELLKAENMTGKGEENSDLFLGLTYDFLRKICEAARKKEEKIKKPRKEKREKALKARNDAGAIENH